MPPELYCLAVAERHFNSFISLMIFRAKMRTVTVISLTSSMSRAHVYFLISIAHLKEVAV